MISPTAIPRVTATRYVLPLREGGSLPGLVEASDDGTYVMKLTGAGQGPRVLVAEVIVAGLARALDIPTPELVVLELHEAIARFEADEEVQDVLTASLGPNLGVDFLPGAFGYDGSQPPDAALAGRILWLDALTANVDRTWSNPNLLRWHGQTWAIDHGAALYFHHSWPSRGVDPARFAAQPYDAERHILRGPAGDVSALDGACAAVLTPDVVRAAVEAVPAEWLHPVEGLAGLDSPSAVRAAYVDCLLARLADRSAWLPGPPAGPPSEGPEDLARSQEARRRWTR
ncbi:HipA family kinase [Arsenicicoccus bolidensis]|uniref:HipA family kinase n=1 Tax=Arsenicicoccus bolidensis TaxID=229480 RepID=UPI00040C182B|nr:HipA family kinase [Arsenicicoccus bolidensis]